MVYLPYITRSACKHGVTSDDIEVILEHPEWIVRMPLLYEDGKDETDRPNVDVYGGYDTSGQPLVVFVDRFENIAFHSEPGSRRFGWLF